MMRVSPLLAAFLLVTTVSAQNLEQQLLSVAPEQLAKSSRQDGDARRGAILFHQVHIGCVKCHAVNGAKNALGPDLTALAKQKDATDTHVVTSILKPSAAIRKGFEPYTVVTDDGKARTGLLISRSDTEIVLRDPATGERISIPAETVDEAVANTVSVMPKGIANQVGGRQQFLDLVRYVLEIKDGGPEVARSLQPPPGMITFKIPEYEARVDHAKLISSLDNDALKRGQKIYNRLCINCHGDHDRPGSLPTALRFAEGKFRNGGDPHTMYRTLTHGFGLMVPQTWMVPRQKYDVIHYIRETYVKPRNEAQYIAVNDSYLSSLPKGDTLGPDPVEYAPWSDMNYGPAMINTFEIGNNGRNFAYKGIATRLDAGPGGVSKGNKWMVFDHDTLRIAAAWTRPADSRGNNFINWQGIHFDGRHNIHPRVVGDLHFENPTGPGWARPGSRSFEDNARVVGRDDRRYGPLPRDWAQYRGLYMSGDESIVSYAVGRRDVLEKAGHLEVTVDGQLIDVFTRTMSVGPGNQDNLMLVATHADQQVSLLKTNNAVSLQPGQAPVAEAPAETSAVASRFGGNSWLQINEGRAFDMTGKDFTIMAKIRTRSDGTIFSRTAKRNEWVRDGKTFFIRGGRLCYDIGWVGVVSSDQRVADGKWHKVAITWDHKKGEVQFIVDGKSAGGGTIRPSGNVRNHVARIGFSAANFPKKSAFKGDMESVSFHQADLSAFLQGDRKGPANTLVAQWNLTQAAVNGKLPSAAGKKLVANVQQGAASEQTASGGGNAIAAGVIGADLQLTNQQNRLCLEVAASDNDQKYVVWTTRSSKPLTEAQLASLAAAIADKADVADLNAEIKRSSAPRWPEVLTTTPVVGAEDGPFAIDVLAAPESNPWLARVRLTGHDFFPDGDRVAVCSWDGDVYMVTGLKTLTTDKPELKWRRISAGLFQPLGLMVVAGDIYVTCRDQLVILRDRNQDGETDHFECFNNDHQVTEHFHEFAMGLQRDEVGNFYYAKSARHALKAIVPHHGTLLRIPSDGSRTDILATGFRAANGVCLNPDGSFIVTDQEGHWNPKNRINWVREGGFYGNMFGYHEVTDSSNDAMEQPLCWITNAFDRSPAELMWVNNKSWGPLNGSLLNLSYGYGKIYVVPHEEVDEQMQGGMCQLPIPQFPTGIVRGRISPHDNGLYLTGMFAWAGSQHHQGGFYRLRYTGKPAHLPVGLNASGKQVTLSFTDPVDPETARNPGSYAIKVWSLKRTASYGSKHYDEHPLKVAAASVSDDGKTVTLTLPELAPTWCMEIKTRLKTSDGTPFERVIHNTIHKLQ